MTHRSNSIQPPPTRTMTVRLRSIRQKHSFARPSHPIQYVPDASCHLSMSTSPSTPTPTPTPPPTPVALVTSCSECRLYS